MASSNKIIVIGRQFGSGGRRLGKMLAQKRGIPYYDKELLSEAASRLGFRADIFETADERKPSLMRSMFSAANGSSTYFTGGGFNSERIYQLQSDVIRQLMDEGPCVIVGRTADYIGRDRDELLSVFLHSELDDRVANVKESNQQMSDSAIRDMIRKTDSKRRNYYNYFTGRNWGEAANYDMTFNTSRLSLEAIADIISSALDSER